MNKRRSASKTPRSFVPDWARDAIWYQIFPERFQNGAPQSDPEWMDFSDLPVADWTVCPWGMDWYDLAPWEKATNNFYRSVYSRRYGGDLVGVRDKLDYLQKLGINAIYLNPIFMAPSLHKYDASYLHHIDPALGPDRQGDLDLIARAGETEDPGTWIWTAADRFLLELVQDVHRRGMRIILDGVFNHVGTRFFGFQDVVKKGRASRYADWFRIKKWNADGTFEYEGWFGHKGLPELARDSHNLAKPVREYIFHITKRWMDPYGDGDSSKGVDGWRLDVAFCVPHGFWKSWRQWVRKLNPEAYLTGEIVGPADEFLQGDEFDAVMNYMWLYPTLGFFSPCEKPLSVRQLQQALNSLRRRYPAEVAPVLQNLMDSHDTGRILTLLENACPPFENWDSYFNYPRAKDHPQLITTRPRARAKSILQQMVIFQMTYPGAPMIYYGTEVGMWGGNDPDNRQPMLWPEIVYEPEAHGPNGRPCRRALRAPDRALFSFYRKAIGLRHAHAVLRRGRFKWVQTDHDRLLAFCRSDGSENLLVLLNAGDRAIRYTMTSASTDVWNQVDVRRGAVLVDPRGWRILRLRS
jgi:cyclomaltodextrinase